MLYVIVKLYPIAIIGLLNEAKNLIFTLSFLSSVTEMLCKNYQYVLILLITDLHNVKGN